MDPRDVLSRPAEAPDVVLRYAEHIDGVTDVFLPPSLRRPTQPHPLVVAIHGGFWRQDYGRQHLRPLAQALAARGFVVAVPEYRRVGGAGGWPLTAYDVEAALAAVPALIEAAAPGRVADGPCVVTGHSAGGHLAMWAGLRAGQARVRRIVALAPVADLLSAAAANLDGGAVQDLLGGEPDDVPDNYAEADALGRLTGDIPVTVIQGSDDRQVPVELNRQVSADHPTVCYVELTGVEHFALIDPLSPVFESTVLPALIH